MYNLFQNFFGKMVKTLKMSKRGQIYMEDPVGTGSLVDLSHFSVYLGTILGVTAKSDFTVKKLPHFQTIILYKFFPLAFT